MDALQHFQSDMTAQNKPHPPPPLQPLSPFTSPVRVMAARSTFWSQRLKTWAFFWTPALFRICYEIWCTLPNIFLVQIFKSQATSKGFPCGSDGKESACNVGDLDLIPGLGRSPREGKGYLFQYSGLENSMDCTVHGGHKESDTTEQLPLQYKQSL